MHVRVLPWTNNGNCDHSADCIDDGRLVKMRVRPHLLGCLAGDNTPLTR